MGEGGTDIVPVRLSAYFITNTISRISMKFGTGDTLKVVERIFF
jgi:hypothetical protein